MKLRPPRVRRVGRIGRLTIYLVSGVAVRNQLDIDFTQGGNEAIYPSYVPAGEIWIDAVLGPRDRAATILHEMVERHLMIRHGQDYDHAHDVASARERVFRTKHDSSLASVAAAYRSFLRAPLAPVAKLPRPDERAARPRNIRREIDDLLAERARRA